MDAELLHKKKEGHTKSIEQWWQKKHSLPEADRAKTWI
jgi:hypothetical protein